MQAIQKGLHVVFCGIEPVPQDLEGASVKGIKGIFAGPSMGKVHLELLTDHVMET